MKRWLVYVALGGVLSVAACKPALHTASPLETPLLSPVEPLITYTSQPVPTSTSMFQPRNKLVHIVRAGDTIFGLALQYDVPVEQILRLNGLESNTLLRVGQALIISDPSVTTVVLPTSTPFSTLTPTSVPTIVPPLQIASFDNQPTLTQDLLYLQAGRLMRWNHLTGRQEVLAGPESSSQSFSVQPISDGHKGPGPQAGSILAYSVSKDGKLIAVGRSTVARDRYELGLLDLNTKQVKVFYESASLGFDLLDMSVSPDGKYIAWIPSDLNLSTSRGRSNGLTASVRGGGSQSGVVFIVAADALEQKREVGHCSAQRTVDYAWGCNGLLWSPDSRYLAWADGNGVWILKLGGAPRQLMRTAVTTPDKHQVEGVYTLRAWSPSGRYTLLSAGHYEGSSLDILDMETGSAIPVPGSFEYAYSGPDVAWGNDDQLFIGRSGQVNAEMPPVLETWHIDSSNGVALTLTYSLTLSVGSENMPLGLAQLADGRLALALVNRSNTNYFDRGLYFAAPKTLVPQKVNGLPPLGIENINTGGSWYLVDVLWTLDGDGALVSDRNLGQVLYIPADGTTLYDLRSLIGESAQNFKWIRP